MRNWFLFGLYLSMTAWLCVVNGYAQSSAKNVRLDSLLKIDVNVIPVDSLKADHYDRIATTYSSSSDYLHACEYWQKSMDIATSTNDKQRAVKYLGSLGLEYIAMAHYPKALECFLKALAFAEQAKNRSAITNYLNHLGRVYMFLGDYPKALEYYQKALVISEAAGLKNPVAKQLRNIGNTYNKMGDYPKAIEYLKRSQLLFDSLGIKEGGMISLGIIGSVYLNIADYERSLEYLQKALVMSRQANNKRQESMNLLNIGKAYREAPDHILLKAGIQPAQRNVRVLEYLYLGQQTAKEINDAGTEKIAWEALSDTHEKQGNYIKAYQAYKQYIVLRDSIEGSETKNTIAIKEMQFDFDKRETKLLFDQQLTHEKLRQQELLTRQQQLDLGLKQQQLVLSLQDKNLQHLVFLKTQAELQQERIAGENQQALSAKKDAELKLLSNEKALQETKLELTTNELTAKENQRNGFIIGTVLLLFFATAVVMGLKRTSAEKKKSEALLLNILPSEVAMELKQTGEAIAKQYNHVTVLFTDFVNFTGISEQLSPTELVAEVHKNFTAFDAIIEKHGLEKIKTIGDAYLAVCGLPNETENHAQQVVRAALDIQLFMSQNGNKFQVRIGINSGAVVAGIVGVKKYAYDIWGDTVNTASRMESCSEAGKINISGATYELIKHDFRCEHRGKITAKNKGAVDMYFVEGV
ncbi:MAG: adenylate/guanylate cyclase domain-containing protein [Bacteroidota bacterium]